MCYYCRYLYPVYILVLFCHSYEILVHSLAKRVYYLLSRNIANISSWVMYITWISVSEALFEISE